METEELLCEFAIDPAPSGPQPGPLRGGTAPAAITLQDEQP